LPAMEIPAPPPAPAPGRALEAVAIEEGRTFLGVVVQSSPKGLCYIDSPGAYGILGAVMEVVASPDEVSACNARIGDYVLFELDWKARRAPEAVALHKVAVVQNEQRVQVAPEEYMFPAVDGLPTMGPTVEYLRTHGLAVEAPQQPPMEPGLHFGYAQHQHQHQHQQQYPPGPPVDAGWVNGGSASSSATADQQRPNRPVYETVSAGVLQLMEGFAFVRCDGIRTVYGKDCWVSSQVADKAMDVGIENGDTVAFKVHVARTGQPQVNRDTGLVKMPSGATHAGVVNCYFEYQDRPSYGFVICPGLSGDAYIAHDQAEAAGGLSRGDAVAFVLEMRNGSPQATSIVKLDEMPVTQVASTGAASGKTTPYAQAVSVGKSTKGKGEGKGGEKGGPDPEAQEGPYFGVIKRFCPQGGFGFVECPELMEKHNRDAYLSLRAVVNGGLPHQCQGKRIKFWLHFRPKTDKPMAVNVTEAPDEVGGGPAPQNDSDHGQGAAPY